MTLRAEGVNVATLLEHAAHRRDGAPAILTADGRVLWTFGGLAESAARLAGGLVDRGLGPGDRVLVLEPDLRELYRIIIGVIWAGAAATVPPLSVPLPAALRIAGGSRPTAVIASLALWPAALLVNGLRNAPIRLTTGRHGLPGTGSTGALDRHTAIAPVAVALDSPAVVSFTTGSTGAARAITRTHGVLRAQHEALGALRTLDDTAVDLAGLPVLVLHNLGSGITSVPAPRNPASLSYGSRIRAALTATGATSMAGFPHLFESALDGARPGALDRLVSMYVGGSRVRPKLLTALQAGAPGARVTVVYGSTEVEPISAIGADAYLRLIADHEPSAGVCVGHVLDGLEVRLASEAGSSPAGHAGSRAGRILVRGPRAAGEADADGWVDTGDLGRLADDGRLWLLGRQSNAIGDLWPIAIERLVESLSWVERAAFVGLVGDAVPRERGIIAVQPRQWGDSKARAAWITNLRALARDNRWPVDETLLLQRLPRLGGAAAKVDDDRLRRLAPGGLRGRVAHLTG